MREHQTSQRAAHWDNVYRTKAEHELSWHEDEPALSIELVTAQVPRGSRVIDVGGGSSILAGRLAALGYETTVLDISSAAIERAQARLGDMRRRIHWIVGDVTGIADLGSFDLWHDRAVFHFLIDPDDQRRYAALAARTVVAGGHLIIGTFGLTSPEKCSGLPVQRHEESTIESVFGEAFAMIRSLQRTHVTPWGKPQAFLFSVLQRRG